MSRKTLPFKYSKEDTIFNISHSSLLTAAFMSENWEMLKYASNDQVHQKYRMKQMPELFDVQKTALKEGALIEDSPVKSKTLATIVKRIEDNTISGKAAKEVLDYLMENESDVDSAIEKLGLKQVSDDGALLAIIDAILAANADKVAEYRSGKDKLFGFFVGQTMKESKGSANPNKVNDLLKQRLS
jgi:Asp-tRNA(Asn)/Glu-tRNA(Gln) amidotransferase B subunit